MFSVYLCLYLIKQRMCVIYLRLQIQDVKWTHLLLYNSLEEFRWGLDWVTSVPLILLSYCEYLTTLLSTPDWIFSSKTQLDVYFSHVAICCTAFVSLCFMSLCFMKTACNLQSSDILLETWRSPSVCVSSAASELRWGPCTRTWAIAPSLMLSMSCWLDESIWNFTPGYEGYRQARSPW